VGGTSQMINDYEKVEIVEMVCATPVAVAVFITILNMWDRAGLCILIVLAELLGGSILIGLLEPLIYKFVKNHL